MVIRKVGDKFCVFSKAGKNLGCSDTREGAVKRLRQVEYFKNKGQAQMSYDKIFENLSVNNEASNTEASEQKPALVPNGTVAGYRSDFVKDNKDHFPITTQTQALSSMNRVLQLEQRPDWYGGSLDDLRNEVYAAIKQSHPDMEIKVSVPVAVALSDGQESSSETDVKDPNNDLNHDKVPQVKRPKLKAELAQVVAAIYETMGENPDVSAMFETATDRRTFAGDVVEMLKKQQDEIKRAMKVANRLMDEGLSGEEFAALISFLQEDILRDLLRNGAKASDDFSREEVIAKMKNSKKKKKLGY